MSCYKPLEAWRQAFTKQLTFRVANRIDRHLPPVATSILLPCGQCIGCRLDRSRRWADRCVHQARFSDDNYFLTLTFSDAYLPRDNSIRTWHLQDFWYRCKEQYRREADFFDSPFPDDPPKFKYYAAGEYGEQYSRVHYHACVFNFPLPDKKYFKKSGEFSLYTSSFLSQCWPWGHAYVADFSFETAAYVARYISKKILGKDAEDHYKRLGVEPERAWMSKGLGREFYEAYAAETYRDDYIISRGHRASVPRAYDRWLEKDDPAKLEAVKLSRVLSIEDKNKVLESLFSGEHHVAMLVKQAQLAAFNVDRGR